MRRMKQRILFLLGAFMMALLYMLANANNTSGGRIEFQGRYYGSLEELMEENSNVIGCGPRMTIADLERGYYDAREGMQIVCFSSHEESDNLYRQNEALRDKYELAAEMNAELRN